MCEVRVWKNKKVVRSNYPDYLNSLHAYDPNGCIVRHTKEESDLCLATISIVVNGHCYEGVDSLRLCDAMAGLRKSLDNECEHCSRGFNRRIDVLLMEGWGQSHDDRIEICALKGDLIAGLEVWHARCEASVIDSLKHDLQMSMFSLRNELQNDKTIANSSE